MIFRRQRALRDLDRDLRDHIDAEIRNNLDRGMPIEEARRAAHLSFGNPGLVKEDTRAVWVPAWLDGLGQDLRQSLRSLARSRKQVLVAGAVLSVSLALAGAATTMIWNLIIEPLDVDRPEQLAIVRVSGSADLAGERFTIGQYREIAAVDAFETSAIAGYAALILDAGGGPRQITATFVSEDYFRVLGVPIARGRGFDASDMEDGGEIVAVLSDGLWRDETDGSDDVLGRRISVGEQTATVVGVAAPGFRGTSLDAAPTLFLPLSAEPARGWLANRTPFSSWLIVGRLSPLDSIEDVAARLPVSQQGELSLVPLRDAVAPVTARLEIFGVARLLTSVSVVFLLLGATTLSMALALQTERRGGEIAVRCALGATSGRIASMLAVEVGVVVLLATLLAFPLAAIALEAAGVLSLPGNLDVGSLDLRLGALAARAIVFSGSFVGLAAFLLTRTSAARLAGAHPAHGGIAGPGVAPGWLRRGFVVVLLAVTVCLLGSGTFFTQTLQRSLSIDLGYQADRLLNVDFNLVDHAYTPVEVETFFGHLRESLSADPVVVQAAVTRSAGGMGPGGSLQYDGAPVDPGEFVRYLGVDREYFDAAGLRLLYGRNFTVDDRQEAQLVGIASESLARFLGAEGEADVLGHSLYIGSRGTVTIVGVAEDRVYSPRLPGAMDLHLPTAQVQYAVPSGRASLARGRVILDVNDAGQARRRVLARVRELDSDVVPVSMQTAEEELLSIFALQHLASRMTGVFGLVALALVTISLHSLVLSIVTARRKEIAIRTALGATGRNVLAWFGREIARPLGVGILFGMAGVWMAYRGMTAYIVGLAADDLSAVVAVITAACLLAAGTSLGAALWATREPPYSVLREN